MAMDMYGAVRSLSGVQQAIIYLAAIIIIVAVVIAVGIFLINRSMRIKIKIDLRERHTGILKRTPYPARIFVKREGGGEWVTDIWGYTSLNSEKVGVLKFAGFTFPAPRFEDIHPGNLLILFSPNSGEVYPLRIDEDTKTMKASVDYNVAGHVFTRIRSHAALFDQTSALERMAPVILTLGAIILSVFLVFLVTNMLLDRFDAAVAAGMNCAQNQAPVTPPPV